MIIHSKHVARSLIIWLSCQSLASLAADAPNGRNIEVKPELLPEVQARPNKTREELFLEVFKRPPPDIPVSGYVVIVLDGEIREKIKAVLLPDERRILLEGRAVMAMLSQRLRPDVLQRLERSIGEAGWLSRAAIDAAGVTTSFDTRKFEFAMVTDPGLREKNVKYLGGIPVDPFSVDAIRPAAASAFLNFNVKAARRLDSSAGSTSEQSSVGLAVDGATNLMGVVLEGSAFGQTGSANSVQRGDLRLVHDRPQQALRYSAGDLRYPVVGYQTTVEMGGIGIARDFSLQPHLRNYQSSQFEFYLERPAEVKIWVNESLVTTLQLPAGTHDIRGLAPAVGLNDTRLVVEDSAGRRETLNYSFIYSPILLEKGKNLFSYNAGFRRESRNGRYRYDTGKPVLSASYLEGVTGETTLGAYMQADASRSLFGVQAIQAFPSGTLQLDAASSKSDAAKWDVATKLDWIRLPDLRQGQTVQSQVSIEYLGRAFGTINDFTPAARDRINFYASLAFPVANATAQFSGLFTPARNVEAVDAHSLIASLTRRWGQYTTATVSLRHRRSSRGEMQTGLFFGVSFSFSNADNNFYAAKEIETDTATLSWSSARPSNSAVPYGFASSRIGSGVREYTGGIGYWGRQGVAEASQSHTQIQRETGRFVRDETAVRLQSAVVFAKDSIAMTRSVSENFAIVKGKEGLAGIVMKVDPDGQGGSKGQSSWLGPAVVGDLGNYQLRKLQVEPVNPPVGATPEKLTYSLAPTYKSGFLLELGKEFSIVAFGRLVDEQNQPLAHVQIEVRRAGDRSSKPVATFTSRAGAFQLPDIKPGRYEIRPSSAARWDSVFVDIPAAPDGLYRLGDIQIQPK